MSIWKQYLKKRQLREGLGDGGDPVAKFKFNQHEDEDYAEDYEKIQQELFKTVMSKYPNETVDFLNSVANRGDEEISSLLRKMKKDKGTKLPREPQHPTDGHEVVPSSADSGHNPEFGEE